MEYDIDPREDDAMRRDEELYYSRCKTREGIMIYFSDSEDRRNFLNTLPERGWKDVVVQADMVGHTAKAVLFEVPTGVGGLKNLTFWVPKSRLTMMPAAGPFDVLPACPAQFCK